MCDISVVIPCYNSSLTIERCLESVYTQTLIPDEIIIIIDKSKDIKATIENINNIEKKYGNIEVVIIVPDEKAGVSGARNLGCEKSKCKYIAFLDSDDAWHRDKLRRQLNFLMLNPDVDVVCAETEIYDENRKEVKTNWSLTKINKIQMLFHNAVSTRTVMLKRILAVQFEPGKQHSEDYLLWLQLLYSGKQIIKFNEILAYSFKDDYLENGLASNLEKAEMGEINTYMTLFRLFKLNKFLLSVVIFYSIVKYLRRRLIKVKTAIT